MNTKFFVLLFGVIMMLIIGCKPAPKTLTEAEKAEIVREVEAVHSDLVEAVQNHDAQKIMSFFLNGDNFKILHNGQIDLDWMEFSDAVHKWHSENKAKTLTLETRYVDVLSRDIVVVSGVGTFPSTDSSGKEVIIKDVWNGVFVKQSNTGEWKVVIAHESTNQPF